MARAAFLAGVSFSVSSVTLIHGMSRPLGARFHIPHGRSNAVLAPLVTHFSLAGNDRRYARVADELGAPAGDLPAYLAKLNDDLGVPSLADCLPTDWVGGEHCSHVRVRAFAVHCSRDLFRSEHGSDAPSEDFVGCAK